MHLRRGGLADAEVDVVVRRGAVGGCAGVAAESAAPRGAVRRLAAVAAAVVDLDPGTEGRTSPVGCA